MLRDMASYVRALFKTWEQIACGALSFAFGVMATYQDQGGTRKLLAILAIAAFALAGFLAWRAEYKKTAESPSIKSARDEIFEDKISSLSPAHLETLRRLVLNDTADPRSPMVMTINSVAPEFVSYQNGGPRPNQIYLSRLRRHFGLK